MKCFYCGEDVITPDIRFIALEKPYANIPVHKVRCLDEIINYDPLKYFTENIKRVYEYIDNQSELKKKKRGTNGI